MTKTLALALALSTGAACTDDAPMAPAPEMPAEDLPQQPETPPAPAAGTLDTTFGTGGMRALGLPGYASSITRQGDKLVVCANQLASVLQPVFARYKLDGALDKTFGISGLTKVSWGVNLVCERVEARPDGSLVASMRMGNERYAMSLDAAGHVIKSSTSETGLSGFSLSGGTAYHARSLYVGLWFLQIFDDDTGSLAKQFYVADESSANRIFVQGDTFTIAGQIHTSYGMGWGVLRGNASSDEPDPYVINAGADSYDILHDAIVLRDGTTFLVGGMDTDLEVQTAHFVSGVATVETHKLGAASTGRAVVLDGADRPVVVGGATIDAQGQYMWQRYDADGVAVDETYAGGGVMAAPALSGSGELVGAVRVNGAIYALATNDVETSTPSVGLVKIVE